MHFSAVLPVLAAVVAAEQAIHPGHLAVKRELVARQTATPTAGAGGDGADAECLSALMGLYSTIPTPPPEVLSFAGDAATATGDLCTLSIPETIKPAYSSYEAEVVSWLKDNEKGISSALDECPQYSAMAESALNSAAGACSTAPAGGAGGAGSGSGSGSGNATQTSGSAQSTGGSGTTGGNGSPDPSIPPNAGARNTGFLAGAVAVAGFVGAVAAL